MDILPLPDTNYPEKSLSGRKLKIFTWHIHGSYLFYLSKGDYDLFIPVNSEKNEGYYGRGETFPFGDNVHEVRSEDVKNQQFDCILFQTNKNYFKDQFDILSEAQRNLPKLYLEHDPPTQHPTNTSHVVKDTSVTLVHVTHFNHLMWDNNETPVCVIDHGIIDPQISFSGNLKRGLVVINNLSKRGRLLGLDLFLKVREQVPLDLIGMGTGDLGLGEILHPQLPAFTSQYRFFFNPIRYTSLGLAVLEAMMMGLPVVGMATTELSNVIKNGTNGFISTDINYLINKMHGLLDDQQFAAKIGQEGRKTALEKFNINRFTIEWKNLFYKVINDDKHYTSERSNIMHTN